jgi:hypothetical protein
LNISKDSLFSIYLFILFIIYYLFYEKKCKVFLQTFLQIIYLVSKMPRLYNIKRGGGGGGGGGGYTPH